MKQIKIFNIIAVLVTLVLLTNCVKDEFNIVPTVVDDSRKIDFTPNITIADFKARYAAGAIIDSSFVIQGTVISSDESENVYKSLYIQDSTGGLVLSIDMQEMFREYPIGQLLYVKCEGLYFGTAKNVHQLQLWSEAVQEPARIPGGFVRDYLYKIPGGQPIQPKRMKISQLNDEHIATLIRLEGVQFSSNDTSKTYAILNLPSNAQTGEDRTIEDFAESTIILRNSNFATFNLTPIPKGRGDVVSIFTKYYDTKQLVVNGLNDVGISEKTEERIVRNFLVFEDFNTSLGLFTGKNIKGSQNWYNTTYNGTAYAYMSGYSGTPVENEDWLVSDSIDLSTVKSAILTFRHAINKHSHSDWSDIQILISNDYDETKLPTESGTWIQLEGFLMPPGNDWTFISAGSVDIKSFAGSNNVRVAFRYTSSNSNASAWEIDNVKIITE